MLAGVVAGVLLLAMIARGRQYGIYSDALDGKFPGQDEADDADDFYPGCSSSRGSRWPRWASSGRSGSAGCG
ncbi:hypothetical protein NKH77_22525 [Streptomyces sp. M19]